MVTVASILGCFNKDSLDLKNQPDTKLHIDAPILKLVSRYTIRQVGRCCLVTTASDLLFRRDHIRKETLEETTASDNNIADVLTGQRSEHQTKFWAN